MRGLDYFSKDDENAWRDMYDRQSARWKQQQASSGRSWVHVPITQIEYDHLYQTLCDDNNYVQWRQREDVILEGNRVLWKGIPELNIDSLQEITFDRPRLAPFKLKYDTIDEVRMRFHKTIILVKGNPFYVTDQRQIKNDFFILVEDAESKKAYCPIENIPDLRPAPPGYIRISELNGYFKRMPARVNQQGLTAGSVSVTKVGGKDHIAFGMGGLVEALSGRRNILKWDTSYRKLMDDRIVSSFRLSDTVALYTKHNSDPVIVEYKGRRLGELTDHTVKVFDEDDIIQPWLKADTQKVDLEVSL